MPKPSNVPLLVVVSLLLLAACAPKQEKIQPTISPISESVYASGNIKSKNQYQVYSTANGLIQKIVVTEGAIVKKGDPLFFLLNETSKLNTDNARLAAEYAGIGANKDKLKELEISIDLAKSKQLNDSLLLVRQQNLWTKQIGTQVELEQKELTFKNSKTAHETALLRYRELEKQLTFTAQQSKKNLEISSAIRNDYCIRSELDGKVYSILKEPGEMVNLQSPVAIIGDATEFVLELQVDEYDIAKIKIGQKIVIGMNSYKGQAFEAMLTKIYPMMNERSRSFTIEAVFTKSPPSLYPFLTVEANIIIQTKEKALTIPRNYLLEDDFVILENKEKKKVTVGLKDYQRAEILDGLTVNDILLNPLK